MLKGQLDVHLDYNKYDKTTKTNARNDFSNKKIKTSFENARFKFQETEIPLLIP
jgi:putative transposase